MTDGTCRVLRLSHSSRTKHQQASLTQVPKAPCSPPQPANTTVTLASLPSSRCSAPSIMLYPQNCNRGSISPGIANNQGREADSHSNTPGRSHPPPPTPLRPTAPHPADSTVAAPCRAPGGQQAPSHHLCPPPRAPGAPHACSAAPAALSFSLLKNYVA